MNKVQLFLSRVSQRARAVDWSFTALRAEGRWLLSAAIGSAYVGRYPPLHIVTGADTSHEKSLLLLLESIRRFEPLVRTTVWDLGLSAGVEAQIAGMSSITLRKFEFDRYPGYFDVRVEAGQYAWKPTIVDLMNTGAPEIVLWLDAGNRVVGRLFWIRRIVGKFGFFSPASSGTLKTWTHPTTLRRLKFESDPSLWGNLSGGLVGFRTDHLQAAEMIRAWARAAMDEECIAPAGSSRSNHRQDQAVLSVLAVQRNFVGREDFRRLARPLNVAIHQDVD